jgi:hypothetical protein
MDATSGVTPPLLPTLLVALVLGAASLICREPDAPAPVPATAISITLAPRSAEASEATATAMAAENFLPATLAFPRQFPLVMAAQAPVPPQAAAPGPHRPAGSRVATLRRTAPAKAAPAAEALHGQAAQADPIPHVATVEAKRVSGGAVPAASGDLLPDLSLPDLALPFAPAIQAAGRARDFVGAQSTAARTQATALGGAVVEFVEALR